MKIKLAGKINVFDYLNNTQDSEMTLEVIKIHLFGTDYKDLKKESLLRPEDAELLEQFNLLNKKIGTSKITQFESMCNRLLSFDIKMQKEILKSNTLPECFIPICGSIQYPAQYNLLFFTKPESRTKDYDCSKTLYAIFVIRPPKMYNAAKKKKNKEGPGDAAEADAEADEDTGAVPKGPESTKKKDAQSEQLYYVIVQPVHKRNHPIDGVRDIYTIIDEYLEIQKSATPDCCWFYYDGLIAAPSWSVLREKFKKTIYYAASVEYRENLNVAHIFPLIPLSTSNPSLLISLKNTLNTIIKHPEDQYQKKVEEYETRIRYSTAAQKQVLENELKEYQKQYEEEKKKFLEAMSKPSGIVSSICGDRKHAATGGPRYSRFCSRSSWEELASIIPNLPTMTEINLCVARSILEEIITNLYENKNGAYEELKINEKDTLYSVIMRIFQLIENHTLYYKSGETPNKNEYYQVDSKYVNGIKKLSRYKIKDPDKSAILKKLSNFLDLVKQIGYQLSGGSVIDSDFNLPFGTASVHISPDGRLSVDVPLYVYDWMPAKIQDLTSHPYLISLGFDAGRRDYGTIAITRADTPVTPNVTLKTATFSSQEAEHRTKSSRSEREGWNSSKINRRAIYRWRKVSHRGSSGRRQSNRLKQLNRSVVYRSAMRLMSELNTMKKDIKDKASEWVKAYYAKPDVISSFEYASLARISLPDRIYRWYSRMVFEDLSNFDAVGGDIFSSSISGSTAWTGTGVLRKCAEELSETLGISLLFVPPHYTSKMSCFSKKDSHPNADAGWLVQRETDSVKIYSPPVEFTDQSGWNAHIQRCIQEKRYREYKIDVQNQKLIGGSSLSRGLIKRLIPLSVGLHFVEVQSGKWVRIKYNNTDVYIDRDINAALNLSQYNVFEWQTQLCSLMKYRITRGVHKVRSKKTYNFAQDHALKLEEKKNMGLECLNISELSDFLLLLHSNWKPPAALN